MFSLEGAKGENLLAPLPKSYDKIVYVRYETRIGVHILYYLFSACLFVVTMVFYSFRECVGGEEYKLHIYI